MLTKNPALTVVAIVTLALSIGANTATFSIVKGVLLSPLPYREPERLVALYTQTANFNRYSISYPNFLDWVRDNHSFPDLADHVEDNFNLTGTGEPERVPGERVSASFSPLLGVKALIGRTFTFQEDLVGAPPVVLISGEFWKRKFGFSQNVLSKTLTLNGVISDSLAAQRFSMILMAIFGGLALVMAAVGTYGVISYVTSQRAHEIGIRMALGARRTVVLKTVVGQGLRLALTGVGIGTVGALAVMRFLASLLYDIKPADPLTFAAVSLILIDVALVSCYIPAWRAAKADPVVALRQE